MCWKTNQDVFLQPIKTKGDIPIFKICRYIHDEDYILSIHQDFPYKLNKMYTLEGSDVTLTIPTVNWFTTSIYKGFHSYITDCRLCSNSVDITYVLGINNARIGCYGGPIKIAKVFGYIPKGSTYYVNENGECVSSAICLTKMEII